MKTLVAVYEKGLSFNFDLRGNFLRGANPGVAELRNHGITT